MNLVVNLATTFAVLLLTSEAARATCYRPCGSPLSGTTGSPAAADALYILREAVGVTSYCYPCECDTDANGSVGATDAFRVLKRAVGGVIVLDCAVCGPVGSDDAFSRGRYALERKDITWANAEFACAVEADPDNSPAQFFYAASRIAAFVADEPELSELLVETGGDGRTDLYDFTMKYPQGVTLPTVARAKPVVLEAFGDELAAAIANLSEALEQEPFSTTFTSAMFPGGFAREYYEVDSADAAVLSAIYRKLRCALYFSIGGYHSSTFDLLHDGLGTACTTGFLANHSQFFTVSSTSAMAIAKSECKSAIGDAITALDLMEEESDPQSDDLVLFDDLSQPSDPRDTREVLVSLRNTFDQSISTLPACDSTPFPFYGGKAFDQPLTRNDLPVLTEDEFGHCVADKNSLPDLSFNGILPGAPTNEVRSQLFADHWPICQSLDIPPFLNPFGSSLE